MVNDRLSIPHRVRKAGTPVAHTFSSRGFTLALGLFVAVLAVYAVFQSPLFRLTTIVVAGAEHLSAADVSEWTGLEMGANLLEVDVRAVQEALRSASAGEGCPGAEKASGVAGGGAGGAAPGGVSAGGGGVLGPGRRRRRAVPD